MKYIKLIALKIDDFYSSIFFENNYALKDIEVAKRDKTDLEAKGYYCILANVGSDLEVLE